MKSNPFSTRFVAPGRIDWVSEPDHELEKLTCRFLFDCSSRAAIVGPHGSGKSTLLEHLVPGLGVVVAKLQPDQRFGESELSESQEQIKALGEFGAEGDRYVVWLQLRGWRNARRDLWETRSLWTRHSILVIDGYEQLLPWRRLQVVRATYRLKCAVLVTSHRRTCLTTLHYTQVTTSVAKEVLQQLVPVDMPGRNRFFDERRLQALLAAYNGNFREVLMELYDDVEYKNLIGKVPLAACIPLPRRPK